VGDIDPLMERPMRIALAQIDCRLGNMPANLTTHSEALRAAAAAGAEFTLFPELSLTGYRLRSSINRVMLRDAEVEDAAWQLCQEGKFGESYCAFGYVELSDRDVIYNTTLLFQGYTPSPIFRHRKVYLPSYGMFEEERYMHPGDRFRTTDILLKDGETWRVGVLCCEDAWHDSAWLIMQARGVDLVLVPSASPGRGVESERLGSQQSWHGILRTQAEFCGCYVAHCNRVGFEDDIHFWGGSAVFSPAGEIVAEGKIMDPDLVLCDLDKRVLTRARVATPLIADENWDLTLRELRLAREEVLEIDN
jgi:predicted amidohydrolase